MKIIQRQRDKAYLDSWLWIPKEYVNVEGTKRSLTFLIAEPGGGARELRLWRETADHLLVPRALWRTTELPYPVVDCRPQRFTEIDFKSNIRLDHLPGVGGLVPTGQDLQQRALQAMVDNPGGILQLACGKGKTVVFLALVARLRVPTLVIIDNTTLLEQWRGEVNKMLKIPGGVGLIQADVFDWQHGLVLSTYHTIAARAATMPEEVRRWFGLIGWDEGHHISAPTFAKSADLFYGKRIALTATPVRVDGTHVVYEFHVGPVLFKDLSQAIKPRIYFKWTGFEVDASDPMANIRDRNSDVHLVKLYAHIGAMKPRLDSIVQDISEAKAQNRQKILVLSNSVPAILNLAALLIHGPGSLLYSDIPVPQPHEVGESVPPLDLAMAERGRKKRAAEHMRKLLEDQTLNPIKQHQYQVNLAQLEGVLHRCLVFDKIQAELRRRQLAFIRELQKHMGPDVGVMIGDIKSEERIGYARNSRVLLAIMKYGKEGLDAPAIDTVLVLDPFSQRNGLQQLIGRVARAAVDKLEPVVVFYEDNVGPIIGMCKKLRTHLSEWSQEEGGPFTYKLFNHPKAKSQWNQMKLFTATGS